MQEQRPATPAPAANPGNDTSVITPPSSAAPNAGNDSEGKVTISVKEFAQLQRDAARVRSAEKRESIQKRNANPGNLPDNLTPDATDLINREKARADEAERKAMQAEVKNKVRDILDKDEFKNIPRSTKDLILRNPGSVTDAEDPEVALLDVEDYLRDVAGKIDVSHLPPAPNGANSVQKPQDAPNRETPPVITPGSPAPAGSSAAEDTTNLRGAAKTQAMVRNKLRGVKPTN